MLLKAGAAFVSLGSVCRLAQDFTVLCHHRIGPEDHTLKIIRQLFKYFPAEASSGRGADDQADQKRRGKRRLYPETRDQLFDIITAALDIGKAQSLMIVSDCKYKALHSITRYII